MSDKTQNPEAAQEAAAPTVEQVTVVHLQSPAKKPTGAAKRTNIKVERVDH